MIIIWGVLYDPDVESLNDMADINLDDSQWGYGEPAGTTCPDIWDLFDLDKLLKLTKEGERNLAKFNTVGYSYRLEVARLPCILHGETLIRILPRSWKKYFKYLLNHLTLEIGFALHLNIWTFTQPST